MKTAWKKYNDTDLKNVFELSEKYKKFLDSAKTEREACAQAIKIAENYGYQDISKYSSLKPGDKVYFNNRDKAICLYHIGSDDIVSGLNILGAHIDSPRIDLKQNPLYETDGLVLFDTHYYGGIKKYQWVAQPLSLHGVVVKKNGEKINISIGENENDPVFGISDLLIHLSKDQLEKKGSVVIEGEDLNAFVGSNDNKLSPKDAILKLFKDNYDIEEADFSSAELELVPAGKARDYGLDRSMIMAYGHDDRVCAYTSLYAMMQIENPARTSCTILVDKEEVGSNGATGMHSRFFENTIAEVLDKMNKYSELNVRRILTNSFMLSSDVNCAFDPNYPSVNEKKNTAFLGKGVVFTKYTGARGKSGCNDANPEFYAKIRNIMDKHNITYQTGELGKVDQGGGGTIAYILANLNMEVIDCGIGLHNMHACYEVASKADIYEMYSCYIKFLEEMK